MQVSINIWNLKENSIDVLVKQGKILENVRKISEKSKYARFYAFYAQIFQNMLAYRVYSINLYTLGKLL